MAKTHYDTLGLPRTCTADEIRSAYRKLVLRYHPDRSKAPNAKEMFLRITEAYEVLGDPARRREYDRLLDAQAAASRRVAQPSPPRQPPPAEPPGGQARISVTLAQEIVRLTVLYSRGRIAEAERLARYLRQRAPRNPVPYAVLGDIERARGNLVEAANLYAIAYQLDPRNELYRMRHDDAARAVARNQRRDPVVARRRQSVAPLVGASVVLLACIYLVLSDESPVLGHLAPVSAWTLGAVVMSFLSGVAIGASLLVGGFLDRFQSTVTTTVGRLSPNLALASVAVVNFWLAAVLYAALGLSQGAFNRSTSRLVGAVAAATVFLALAASVAGGGLGSQMLLWGGNLVYIGAVCGWMVADALADA
ncbi:MAG: DnaJ domain-containing protein [Fimbriimonadales bacterium]|nr:DnaJ domain-containing protein [Fimbriimonadales bacterium]